jgi:hypothetical protein
MLSPVIPAVYDTVGNGKNDNADGEIPDRKLENDKDAKDQKRIQNSD